MDATILGRLIDRHAAALILYARLSWRVALLPYVGEGKLYAEFKLDEPWDSAHNKK